MKKGLREKAQNYFRSAVYSWLTTSKERADSHIAEESGKFVSPILELFLVETGVDLLFNLETAVQGDKVMQDFVLESLTIGGEHSQKVKAPPIVSDYVSKDPRQFIAFNCRF